MRFHDRRDVDDAALRELLEDRPVLVRGAVLGGITVLPALIRLSIKANAPFVLAGGGKASIRQMNREPTTAKTFKSRETILRFKTRLVYGQCGRTSNLPCTQVRAKNHITDVPT